MDCAPLNLAHFHERRSERFLRNNRYDDAIKALQTSLIYLQDAYKNVTMAKSKEVLDAQKWDFERKLRQVEIRKKQHNQSKMEEIDPLKKNSPMLPRSEPNGSAQLAVKAIDKTVKDFDIRFPKKLMKNKSEVGSGGSKVKKLRRRESVAPHTIHMAALFQMTKSEPQVTQPIPVTGCGHTNVEAEFALVPLEVPTFDMNMFTSSSAPSLASFADIVEHLPN